MNAIPKPAADLLQQTGQLSDSVTRPIPGSRKIFLTPTTEEISMKRGLALALTAAATTAALYAPVTADAAAPYFRSCAALTAKWPNGVAKGPVAANKAVRDGYSRPATSPLAKRVYWANYTRLDRDRDGTACEN